jgi:ribosomal silencing factor RsfS
MVILSCSSRRHMRVVADYIVDHYKLKGLLLEIEGENGKVELKPPKVEGAESDAWMLVDLGDIVVQIFSREGRDSFRLEEHWADVQAARDAGLTYEDYIDKKGAAAAAVASTLTRGAAAPADASDGAHGGR